MRWLLLAVWACTAVAAEVTVDATCPWLNPEGYTPVMFTVKAMVATEVEVTATLNDNQARTVIAVPAGETVRQTLLIPGSNRRWSGSVEVEWRASGIGTDRLGVSPLGYRDLDVVVLDPDEAIGLKALRSAVAAQVGAPTQARRYGSGASTYGDERFTRFGAEVIPDRWQGLPAWLTVVTTAAGDRALRDSQRQALAAWTHAGGRLLVASAQQIPLWTALGAQVEVVSEATLVARIKAIWQTSSTTFDPVPVPGTGAVPVYGFVTIAVLFSLLVGPLNFWWCIRKGRRHLLLLTTPLLSLIASVVLFSYGVIADGLGTRRLAMQVMVLDHEQSRAGIWQGISYFAGLSPGSIALDADDLISVIGPEDGIREQPPTHLVWNTMQFATGSWIPARVNRQLAIGMVRPERRRVILAQRDGQWVVTNGFDLPMESFSWTTPTGQRLHLGQRLPIGATAPLVEGNRSADSIPFERIPIAASLAKQDCDWQATFSGPLVPIPGPAAVDVRAVSSVVFGRSSASARASRSNF